jgi:hypothetical protein
MAGFIAPSKSAILPPSLYPPPDFNGEEEWALEYLCPFAVSGAQVAFVNPPFAPHIPVILPNCQSLLLFISFVAF